MPYSYSAGTTTPNLAGLVEYNSVRLNDGTFVLTSMADLLNAAPLRVTVSDLPNADGGYAGPSFKGPRTITLTGYVDVDLLAYVDPACDQLRAAFAPSVGLATLTFNRAGFSAARTITAMPYGPSPVVFEEPVDLEKLVPQRNFTILMIAPNPITYSGGTPVE